jgi:hypothetical protein
MVADPIELVEVGLVRIDYDPAKTGIVAGLYCRLDGDCRGFGGKSSGGARGGTCRGERKQDRANSDCVSRRGMDHSKLASSASMSD